MQRTVLRSRSYFRKCAKAHYEPYETIPEFVTYFFRRSSGVVALAARKTSHGRRKHGRKLHSQVGNSSMHLLSYGMRNQLKNSLARHRCTFCSGRSERTLVFCQYRLILLRKARPRKSIVCNLQRERNQTPRLYP